MQVPGSSGGSRLSRTLTTGAVLGSLLVTPLGVTGTLAATGALLAAAVTPAAAAATGVPGCDELRVGPVDRQGDQRTVTATVPQAVGRVALPPYAFRVVVAGRTEVPVTAERLPVDRTAVVVVLAGSRTTTPAAFDTAKAAALELLVSAPAEASVAVVSGTGPARLVVPLTRDHRQAATALAGVGRGGGGDAAAATELARQQVPGEARGHVVVLTDDGAPMPARPDGPELHQIAYGSAGAGVGKGEGCPMPGAAVPVLAAVDAVVAQLTGSYTLRFTTDQPGDQTLYLRYGDVDGVADLGATAGAAAAAPAPARSTPDDDAGPSRTVRLLLVAAAGVLLLALLALALLLRSRRRRRSRPPVPLPLPRRPRLDAAGARVGLGVEPVGRPVQDEPAEADPTSDDPGGGSGIAGLFAGGDREPEPAGRTGPDAGPGGADDVGAGVGGADLGGAGHVSDEREPEPAGVGRTAVSDARQAAPAVVGARLAGSVRRPRGGQAAPDAERLPAARQLDPDRPLLWGVARSLATGTTVGAGLTAAADSPGELAELRAALEVADRAGVDPDGPVTVAARTAPARGQARTALAGARRRALQCRVAGLTLVVLVAVGRLLAGPLSRPWLFALGAGVAVLAAGWLWLATSPPYSAAPRDAWRRRRDATIVQQGAVLLTRAAMWSSTGLVVDEAVTRAAQNPGYLVARGQSEARRRAAAGSAPTRALVEVAAELWLWLATPGRVFASPVRSAAVVAALGLAPAVVLLLLS